MTNITDQWWQSHKCLQTQRTYIWRYVIIHCFIFVGATGRYDHRDRWTTTAGWLGGLGRVGIKFSAQNFLLFHVNCLSYAQCSTNGHFSHVCIRYTNKSQEMIDHAKWGINIYWIELSWIKNVQPGTLFSCGPTIFCYEELQINLNTSHIKSILNHLYVFAKHASLSTVMYDFGF